MNNEIYLDCAASSPLNPLILDFLTSLYQKKLGNPDSIHHSGVIANLELEKARVKIADKIKCKPEEIYFTSGATESNNLAIKGIALKNLNNTRKEILFSSIEHSSVKQLSRYLIDNGFLVTTIPVDADGRINPIELEKRLSEKTLLVSIIHANNEIGVIQDNEVIGKLCKENGAYFHSDGAQAFCKVSVDVDKMNLDLYSISGHKIHAPKGIGALYIRSEISLLSQSLGGKQEGGIRAGTVPVELASCLAKATELYNEDSILKLKAHQDFLLKELLVSFPKVRIHGGLTNKLPNIINIAFPGHQGKFLLRELDKMGIYISVGSACNSGVKTASETLLAINLSESEANEALRISWGIDTTLKDLHVFINALKLIISDDSQ